MPDISGHCWFSSHRGYQTHPSEKDRCLTHGAWKGLPESFLWIHESSLIHPTRLSVKTSALCVTRKECGSHGLRETEIRKPSSETQHRAERRCSPTEQHLPPPGTTHRYSILTPEPRSACRFHMTSSAPDPTNRSTSLTAPEKGRQES